ncbi:DUF1413 domain-containing protein [Sphingomonas sp. NFR15]|uniref:DUF1413 domain-containing protein n=1 Tax=Sphingomonas sp. NFR15 TaxID=1566282 RepID=UPI000880592F|nr:DUF1413 domain-containing protein [Sphingomonas sp. NFR15]SDA25337.1 protein of unknown function [Sphingomonas sp. NFR15]
MKMIKTIVDEQTYASLASKRKAEGLPSISALFLKKCGVLDDEREAGEIKRRALRLALKKPAGVPFRLQELFPPARWDAFSKGARLRAGKMFKAEVDAAVDGIRAIHKSSSNHQYYVRHGDSA